MDLKDNIRQLYKQLNKKTEFIEMLAKDVNRSPNTIKNFWFGGFWQTPKHFQERTVELLQRTIKNQN